MKIRIGTLYGHLTPLKMHGAVKENFYTFLNLTIVGSGWSALYCIYLIPEERA